MNRKIVVLLLFSCLLSINHLQAKNNLKRQLFKNVNIGWDACLTDDYRFSSIHAGTAYSQKFKFCKKAAWQIGADFSWSKYTLYNDGDFSQTGNEDFLRTRSLSFPLTVGYDIKKTFFTGLKVYTGPTCELILSSSLNDRNFSRINSAQFGWTLGTRIRFLAIFSAKLACNYYPTSLINGQNFNRSNISLSLGF